LYLRVKFCKKNIFLIIKFIFFYFKEIIQIFRNKLEELEPDIEEILKIEYGEKMIKSCETQVKKKTTKFYLIPNFFLFI